VKKSGLVVGEPFKKGKDTRCETKKQLQRGRNWDTPKIWETNRKSPNLPLFTDGGNRRSPSGGKGEGEEEGGKRETKHHPPWLQWGRRPRLVKR